MSDQPLNRCQPGTTSGAVCCYCDAPLSCAQCGMEQPDDSGHARSGVLTEQEPVAWRMKNDWDHWYITQDKAFADTCRDIEKMEVQPLYVSSPLSSADRGRE